MIKQRMMGRTGLRLSELCLGTLNFGWRTDEAASFAILDAYFAAGGNFIQSTSHSPDLFLPSTAATLAESIVGRWWKSRQLRREDVFLATRIYVRPPAGAAETEFNKIVQQACRDSLRRLQTHYLDMVIFEWNDGLATTGQTLRAFESVVRQGLVRYVGASNFPVWRVVEGLARAYRESQPRMEALQADYSLVTRTRFEPEAMPLAQEQRLAFFARSPLAGGFLAPRRGVNPMLHSIRRDWLLERFGNPHGDAAQGAAAAVAARHHASSAQVALAWVLHNPAVTSAIIGVRSAAQLQELVDASALVLSPSDLAQLDRATAKQEVTIPDEVARPLVDDAEPMFA
jgi:1-deoxyxylulose-5-phosphate synthase